MASSTSPGKLQEQLVLHAAFSGKLTLLKELERGFDTGEGVGKGMRKIKGRMLRNALHHAAQGGQTHVCEYLIEELNFDPNYKDAMGETPLHTALLAGQDLTVACLLDHGAHLNVPGYGGLTELHYAVDKGRTDQVRLLLSKGADVDARSTKGTPLQFAAVKGMKDAVEILLEKGANPNSVMYSSCTALIASIISKSVDCVQLLLKSGANPNVSSCGKTPLTIAALLKETEITSCLLKAGADANATTSLGVTPIEVAASVGNLAVVRTLFPVTTHIPSIPDWSVSGIVEYTTSDEVKNQLKLKEEEKFIEAKEKGAEAVKRADYMNAIHWYTEAIGLKGNDAAVLANRSFCWAHLKEGHYALEDATSARNLREDWPKARYRAGVAWKILGNYRMSAVAFTSALELDPYNKEIQEALNKTLVEWKAVGTEDGGEDYDDEDYAVILNLPGLGRCTIDPDGIHCPPSSRA